MIIYLKLHSILRNRLPPESKGEAILQLKKGANLQDLLDELEINRRVLISVNGEHEPDRSRQLKDGDKVKLFSSISGG